MSGEICYVEGCNETFIIFREGNFFGKGGKTTKQIVIPCLVNHHLNPKNKQAFENYLYTLRVNPASLPMQWSDLLEMIKSYLFYYICSRHPENYSYFFHNAALTFRKIELASQLLCVLLNQQMLPTMEEFKGKLVPIYEKAFQIEKTRYLLYVNFEAPGGKFGNMILNILKVVDPEFRKRLDDAEKEDGKIYKSLLIGAFR